MTERRTLSLTHPRHWFGLWLIVLALTCWTGCAPPLTTPPVSLPAPDAVWVDPSKEADGVVLFGTIESAIKAAKGKQIFVVSGDYKEHLVIPEGVTLSINTPKDKPARLLPTAEKPGIIVSKGATLHLRHLVIEGGLRGIELAEGSTFTALGIKMIKNVGQALFGKGAEVQLHEVSVEDVQPTPDDKFKDIGQPQGIRLEQSTLSIHKSTFTKPGDRGINLLKESYGSVFSCSFTTDKFSVAAVAGQESSVHINKATIEGFKEGVFLLKARATIEDVTITKATGNAIFITDESHAAINGARIIAPKKSGVSFSLSGGEIRNVTITKAEEYGIFSVQGKETPQLLIASNTVEDAKGAGIQVVNTAAVIRENIVKNIVSGPAGDDGVGIGALDSDYVVVEGNTVEGCQASCLFFNRSAGLVTNNKVSKGKEGGFLITNAPKDLPLHIVSNQFFENSVAGIFLLTSSATLRKNTITKTIFVPAEQSGSGVVAFAQSVAVMDDNDINENGQHGLLVAQGSTAEVSNSRFKQNNGYGILVQCGASTLTEEKNTYDKNKSGPRNPCR